MQVAPHSKADVLIGESGHGGVDDGRACINHFLRGIAEREPLGDLRTRVGYIPVFIGCVSEAYRDDFDRRIAGKMRSQGSDHCRLFSKKGRIPENWNAGLHAVVTEGKEAAAGILNGGGDPGWSGCLAVNSQQDLFACACDRCDGRIEIGPIKSSLSGLQSTPVLPDDYAIDVRIG